MVQYIPTQGQVLPSCYKLRIYLFQVKGHQRTGFTFLLVFFLIMPKGRWSSRGRTAWADVEAEPDLPINFYVLWNVILQPHEIAFAWDFNMGDKILSPYT